jgi:L-alanine-DL-glutamate epimerase-like enolase superfamily enzyme
LKILSIEPVLLSSPYGDGKVLGQPLGVKTLGFVRVKTDSGMIGLGEAYCAIYVPDLFVKIIESFAEILSGRSFDHPAEIYDQVHIPFISRSGIFKSAYSAIDLALWDIYSQANDKSIAALLSANSRESIDVYASGGSAALSPAEVTADVQSYLKQGHRHFKMRVGFQDWSTDLKRVSAARASLGADSSLMVDAIMGTINPPWNFTTALERSRDLKQFDPCWLEEPLHPDCFGDYQKLRKESPVRIAAGEALVSMAEFESYIHGNCVDTLQPDVTHAGGITPVVRICEIASAHRVEIAMHVWGSRLAFEANAAIAASFDCVRWLEIPSVNLELNQAASENNLHVEHGQYAFATHPGFSLRLSDKIQSAFPYKPGSGYKMPDKHS